MNRRNVYEITGRKTRRVPTRMTQAQYDTIRRKAKDRNMSVSAFVVEAAAHSDNKITIPQLIRIQNLANLAADACEESDPQTAAEIQREVNAIWSSLK